MADLVFLLAAVIEPEIATNAATEKSYFKDGAVWVAFAMATVIALMLWKKVPAAVAKSLDAKIDAIREQLDEAKTLREEAEALKAEYQKKARAAEQDAKAIVARAEEEADSIVAKAAVDAKEMVARKKAMAEAKIAAEQRAAIADLKAKTAEAAKAAAAKLIADKADADTDAKLVDEAITKLG
ncbi:hypothetical protein [Sphingomicrobium sediminis]|uniref:ATP synthase subunit b n=1 Tax=Sphingomicrobium sediminis TaxID=2950949 RepID=A0A9X2EFW3_9SPHN|nr:hypothetical protein [Sphingomicrobium sediminis]MCM8557248.1 hypothetical protein [Sphingomicrobium sediminis]